MKGGTPAILYNMCLTLDKLYSEPIDDLDESIRKKVHTLFMTRWNTFDAPVHSAWVLMNKTFCRMDHDSTTKLELIQVIKDFCTVETADGTKVGRDWKVVKSENVTCQDFPRINSRISASAVLNREVFPPCPTHLPTSRQSTSLSVDVSRSSWSGVRRRIAA
jgi:hypothetical protein